MVERGRLSGDRFRLARGGGISGRAEGKRTTRGRTREKNEKDSMQEKKKELKERGERGHRRRM